MVRLNKVAAAAAFLLLAQGREPELSIYGLVPTIAGNSSAVRPDGKYAISSEGIEAYFVPYAASLSNLFIRDVHGEVRDIVLGFDNASYYSKSRLHLHLNEIPGRYANRIKNSTFEIDGVTYHSDPNDNNHNDTLHGGSNGWDHRNWTVAAHTVDSITFSLVDADGTMGFPGDVTAYVSYTLAPYQWHLRMTALSTMKRTPIMLTSHTYWNLDGFQNPSTPLALNHSLHLPYAGLRTETDSIGIPTGNLLGNKLGSVNDWWSTSKQFVVNISSPALLGNCGFNCTGYDNCYIFNREAQGPYDWRRAPVATLGSPFSGIQIDVYTDQDAFQIYTCNNMNGTFALKETQGFFNDSSRPRVARKHGCVVMEAEDWIDGINNPEWGRSSRQIFGPGDGPYVLEATYSFSLNHTLAATCNQTV
ncbi:hypothetical protein LTR53_005786 [Teratosphaeriaceae sp. CCFEE 6253]|nr:hypothetical protein LTR53_005786 [Teratosphaeriaceae sp. CCFEE 6253]